MELNVGKDWRIRTDPLNWIVERRQEVQKGPNKGTDRWFPQGYYSSLESAVSVMVTKKIMSAEGTDLHTVLAEMKRIEESVLAAVSALKE